MSGSWVGVKPAAYLSKVIQCAELRLFIKGDGFLLGSLDGRSCPGA